MGSLAQGLIKIERQEHSALPLARRVFVYEFICRRTQLAYFSLVPVKIHNFQVTSGATPSFYIFFMCVHSCTSKICNIYNDVNIYLCKYLFQSVYRNI